MNERLYVQQDANWNVTALINTSGSVVERYVYDPYGKPSFLNASWTTLSGSAYAWIYLHQGGRYDTTSLLYNFRMRHYSPSLGRWVQIDPLRHAAGDTNLYRFVRDNPIFYTDPSGAIAPIIWWILVTGAAGGIIFFHPPAAQAPAPGQHGVGAGPRPIIGEDFKAAIPGVIGGAAAGGASWWAVARLEWMVKAFRKALLEGRKAGYQNWIRQLQAELEASELAGTGGRSEVLREEIAMLKAAVDEIVNALIDLGPLP
jgi:RHS repeat-associated protein